MLASLLLVMSLSPAPTAIVDSVLGPAAVAPLQLLPPGTELVLPPNARVRIAYFASCVHETLRGGRVRVGVTASLAVDAEVERVTADCTPPRFGPMHAGVPGALVLRTGVPARDAAPVARIRSPSPILVAAPGSRLVLTRVPDGERLVFVTARDGLADLDAAGVTLEPDAVYRICAPAGCRRIWIDPQHAHVGGPLLERAVRVP